MSALQEPLAVFYRPEMSIDKKNFSPSAGKPRLVVEDWLRYKLPIEIHKDFYPVVPSTFYEVHDSDYVDGVFRGEIADGFDETDGSVPNACTFIASSMIFAADHALKGGDGIACSPSSGFHHAGYAQGHGYCTFNSLALTALHFANLGKRVAILDCDYHFGDGTADILSKVKAPGFPVLHYSVGGKGPNGLSSKNARLFFDDLESALITIANCNTDLVLYQAGADMHTSDPLGGILTTAQMLSRDEKVFSATALCGAAVSWNLAGGYQRDSLGSISPVLALHRQTLVAAMKRPFQRDMHSPVYFTRTEARAAALKARSSL